MVEEPHRKVGKEGPGAAHVVRHRQPAVIAGQDVVGVGRVDPDAVHVVVRHQRRVGLEGAAAVHRHVQPHAPQVDALRAGGVDADLREVHRARVGAGRLAPRLPAVIGAVDPGGPLRLPRSASCHAAARRAALSRTALPRPLDHRVDDARALAVDVDGDTSERAGGESVPLELRPRLARIGGAPERAPRAATIHAAGGAAPLVARRIHHVRLGERHRQVIRPGVVVEREDALPRLAAVGRLVDAAFPPGAEERSRRRHQDDVVVGGVDDDAIDVLRLRKPHQCEGLSPICRLVDPAPPRGALPVVGLAGPRPHQVGVDLRDGHVADGDEPLVLEERLERGAVARGLPHAAVRRPHVIDGGVGLVHRQVGDAPRHGGGADGAEVEALELLGDGAVGLGVGAGGERNQRCRG